LNLKKGSSLKLGIMGGTFDPIHLGHIKVAEVVLLKFHLEEVFFVTARCPPHKSINDIAPSEHRYAMVELAIKDIPYFKSSRIEMERSCPSYPGDTVKYFKEKYGDNWQIYFITGLDALLTIINWGRARTYPGLCQFIAATRPGYNREKIKKRIPDDFLPYITIIEEPGLSISSTEIRSRVKAEKTIDNMVPKVVRDYIFMCGLYQDKPPIISDKL